MHLHRLGLEEFMNDKVNTFEFLGNHSFYPVLSHLSLQYYVDYLMAGSEGVQGGWLHTHRALVAIKVFIIFARGPLFCNY